MRRLIAALAGLMLSACGATASVGGLEHWRGFVHANAPVDLAGPRPDGGFVMAAGGRLWSMTRDGRISPFPGTYAAGAGEPYIALSPGGCFGRGTVYALRVAKLAGINAISANGSVRNLVTLIAPGLLNGIAFDTTGRFGHRLLVTDRGHGRTTVYAIPCHGKVATITTSAPRIEGGIAVAPATFGRAAGDLIAPDELSGKIYAVTPAGKSLLVAVSGLKAGQDTGVESEGFVPAGGLRDALLADRLTPGNHHPGDNLILRLSIAQLHAAGVQPGDLLVAGEGGGQTDAVRCTAHGCTSRHIADGPRIAHIEGHVAFQ